VQKEIVTSNPVIQQDSRSSVQKAILRALLYYDIWEYPLTTRELHCFLPVNGLDYGRFRSFLEKDGPGEEVRRRGEYFFLASRNPAIVESRQQMEKNAAKLWKIARVSMHVIKRFPFVRGVFISGDLSKNATKKESDVDFFLVTSPHRVWISRTLLIVFKKIFLFNQKKYFCLNNFTAVGHLQLDERNLFLATEIAHLTPLFNSELHREYLRENVWITEFFPNYDPTVLPRPRVSERGSLLQRLLELPFSLIPSDRLDQFLMRRMQKVWAARYPGFDKQTRHRIFRSTRGESRAYVGNYQDRVIDLYRTKLHDYGLDQG